jgi:hypothetical protein
MSYTITNLISELKQTKIISSRPDLVSMLTAINKFSENDALRAYLLGNFFKHRLDSDNLLPQDKALLIDTVKQQHLESYFYLKEKPDDDFLRSFSYILAIGGLLAIVGGCIKLMNGSFSYGLGTRYLVPVMREGGFFVIIGIGLLFAGIIRIRHDRQKRFLIKSLTKHTE